MNRSSSRKIYKEKVLPLLREDEQQKDYRMQQEQLASELIP